MKSKNLNYNTYPPRLQVGSYSNGKLQDIGYFKSDYEKFLRKRYKVPDGGKMIVKRSYATNNDLIYQIPKLTKRGKLLETQFRMYKIIYDEVKDEIAEIYGIINESNEEIEILEIQSDSYEMNHLLLQTEVEMTAEKMFEDLSSSVHKLTNKAYKKIYENLVEAWDNVIVNYKKEFFEDESLDQKELYDKIDLWIDNLKKSLLNKINLAFDDLYSESKPFFEDIKNAFGEVKEKIDSIIRNSLSYVQTTAQKIAFKAQRIESYEVILSGHPRTCDKCRKIANKSKEKPINIADLKIGETAPPFHPNCGCTMIPSVSAEKNGGLWEQVVIEANVAFELLAQLGPLEKLPLPFYRRVKSAIWAIGTMYLESINCPLAKEMFSLGMYGRGKGMSEKATSLMIRAMQNSKHLNDEIFKLTEPGKDFDTGKFSFEFRKNEDLDLYYAVQNVNMRIIGIHLGDGFWNIKVRSQDKYDFTTFRNSLAFAGLANNLGEAMQRNGMMTEYDTLTEYDYIWKGRWS